MRRGFFCNPSRGRRFATNAQRLTRAALGHERLSAAQFLGDRSFAAIFGFSWKRKFPIPASLNGGDSGSVMSERTKTLHDVRPLSGCPAGQRGRLQVCIRQVERLVRITSLVALGEHRCAPTHPLFGGGGPQSIPVIGFMRTSVVRVFSGHAPEVHTPNVAGFHDIGSSYERLQIDESGDNSDWIALCPMLLEDLIDAGPARLKKGDRQFFAKPFAPVGAAAYAAQRHFFEVLNTRCGEGISDLAVDEYAIRLLRCILRDANRHWEGHAAPIRALRSKCEARRKAIVETTKRRIAADYAADLSLPALASEAHTSASQLARIFPLHTGFTIHTYQQQIRLRVSLELLRDSSFDLARVATHLGFASHSHFTTTFKRRFGMSPSQFAKISSRGLMRSLLDSVDRSLECRR